MQPWVWNVEIPVAGSRCPGLLLLGMLNIYDIMLADNVHACLLVFMVIAAEYTVGFTLHLKMILISTSTVVVF